MIKINLVSEGKATVRGMAASGATASAGSEQLNNQLLIGLIVVGLLLGGGYWFMKKSELSDLQAEVTTKEAEAKSLERIIQEVEEFKARKAALEERIALINNLKRSQKVPVRVMDQISQDLPDLVWLDTMTLSGSNIFIEGRGLNPNAIALFTENLKQDEIFSEPVVQSLELVDRVRNVYRYTMSFSFRYEPEVEEQEAGAGEPAAAPGG